MNMRSTRPNSVLHPRLDDDGKPVKLNEPSTPSVPETWTDPDAIAMWTPDSATPAELHGVPFAPWRDHPKTNEGWDYVDGLMHDLAEPPLVSSGKKPAAGVVVVEQDGRVWVVHPSNGFAGYRATFPKGHADEGLSLQATAIREAFEESGLKVQITGFIGDVERTQTMTRYYSARRVGGLPAAMGWETQAVALVPLAQLHTYVNRDVDQTVVAKAAFALGSDTTSKPAFSGWQIALGRASGPRPYLGDLQAVGALVRDFIAGIADRYVAVCQGQSTPWEASAADGAECGRMGRIFAGHDPAYESMGEWNEGGGLGRFLAGQLEGMVVEDQLRDPVLAGAQAFAILAHKVYAVLQAVPGDGDGADAQAKLSDIADLMARALLGFENDVFMQE